MGAMGGSTQKPPNVWGWLGGVRSRASHMEGQEDHFLQLPESYKGRNRRRCSAQTFFIHTSLSGPWKCHHPHCGSGPSGIQGGASGGHTSFRGVKEQFPPLLLHHHGGVAGTSCRAGMENCLCCVADPNQANGGTKFLERGESSRTASVV